MEKIIIYGSGGLGREILSLIRDIDPKQERWNPIGFVDDGAPIGSLVEGLPVLGKGCYLEQAVHPLSVVFGFASPEAKATLYAKLKANPHLSFPRIVHPSSCVEPSAQIEEGCVITRFCFVSIGSQIGRCVFINTGAQVGHDTRVGDFCSIMPSANLSGDVTIGERCLIGVQSAILQGLSVGSNSTIGIGSIVLQNIPENCTALGYPARVVKKEA